uniref:Uncharacterized protein n=1 Tax=Romanomermis culicivorax TaxID=13658 RepID=A0A915KAY9_ROMCU
MKRTSDPENSKATPPVINDMRGTKNSAQTLHKAHNPVSVNKVRQRHQFDQNHRRQCIVSADEKTEQSTNRAKLSVIRQPRYDQYTKAARRYTGAVPQNVVEFLAIGYETT